MVVDARGKVDPTHGNKMNPGGDRIANFTRNNATIKPHDDGVLAAPAEKKSSDPELDPEPLRLFGSGPGLSSSLTNGPWPDGKLHLPGLLSGLAHCTWTSARVDAWSLSSLFGPPQSGLPEIGSGAPSPPALCTRLRPRCRLGPAGKEEGHVP